VSVPDFRIDPQRSEAWFEASTSLHPLHGRATGLEGSIQAEVAGGALDLSVAPRMRLELPVERLSSGNPLYDGETRRRIDARRFPRIVGEAREVTESSAPGIYRVSGDLTFHGVTRTVAGEVKVEAPDDRTLVLEGERVFDVREFGLEPPRLMMLRVHPETMVRIRVVARRQEPEG
jgi:polyisoprenoid-binding protein YceI